MPTSDENARPEDSASELKKPSGPIPEAGIVGRWIDGAGVFFAGFFLLSMSILIFEIFMRYVLNAPTLWAHETTIFLCATAFVFGGVYCAARDRHIRVVLIYDAVPPRVRKWLNVAISLTCLFSSAFFAYAAWIMVRRALWAPTGEFRFERTGSAWNPPTPGLLKLFLLIMLVVLCVQFIVISFNYARRAGR